MLDNNFMGMNNGGYGYPQQQWMMNPMGYQVQQPSIPKQESTLSPDQIKEIKNLQFDELKISDSDILIAKCNHIDANGNQTWAIVDPENSICRCYQCGVEWMQQDYTEDGIKSVVSVMNSLINSIKTSSMGSLPKDFATQFYTIQALIQKLPEIIKICNKSLVSSNKLLEINANANKALYGNFKMPPNATQQPMGMNYQYPQMQQQYPMGMNYQYPQMQQQYPMGMNYQYPQMQQQQYPQPNMTYNTANQFVQGGVTPQPMQQTPQPQISRIPTPGTINNSNSNVGNTTNTSTNTDKK